MTSELPPPAHDLRHLDPEVRKERVKLAANGLNAIGLALLIGSIVAPIVDATRHVVLPRMVAGVWLGIVCVFAAFLIPRYIKAKEAS